MMVQELNAKNFNQEALNSNLPVLIDFWAPWCGPCKAVSPIIEALSEEYQDRVKFAKVNVDDCPALASKYGVMSIPTVFIFSGGKIISQTVGAQPKSQFKKALDEALAVR